MYLLRMASDREGKVLMVWYEQEQKSKHYKVFGDNVSSTSDMLIHIRHVNVDFYPTLRMDVS